MADAMEPRTGAAEGTPAPYGRACTNCAKAKCRCLYRSAGTDCERCQRLKKDCTPSVSVRKRNSRRILGSRTAHLEEKLEDLVTLLRQQAVAQNAGSADSTMVDGIITPSASEHSTDVNPQTSSPDQPSDPAPQGDFAAGNCQGTTLALNAQTAAEAPPRRLTSAILSSMFEHKQTSIPYTMPDYDDLPSTQEAEDSLLRFRKLMLAAVPVVYLPPTTTAEDLRREKPALWFTIMMITNPKIDKQLVMGNALRKYVAQRVIVESEKSLDLLQALQVYILWAQYHKTEKPHITNMVSILSSIVFDLMLHKSPEEAMGAVSICFRPIWFQEASKQTVKPRTLEERRAVLMSHFIHSEMSFTLRKFDPLAWTPYMEESLQILAQEAECVGDKVIVALLKYQLILDQINQVTGLSPTGAVVPKPFLSALRTQLYTLKNQLSSEIANTDVLEFQFLFTELIIQELFLTQDMELTSSPDYGRFKLMDACHDLTKRWFDRFLQIPTDQYEGIMFATWCQMVHCLMTLSWLCSSEDPCWSREAAREKFDIFTACDLCHQALAAAAETRRAAAGPLDPRDIFAKGARLFVMLKEGWQAEFNPEHSSITVREGAAVSGEGEGAVFMDTITTGPLALPVSQFMSDESWLSHIFNVSWE